MGQFVFKLPDVGEGTAEAEIVAWHVQPGQTISEDDPLVDVMTDKATVEMTSPVGGRILEIRGAPGEMAAVGSAIVIFETDAGAETPPPPEAAFQKPDAAPLAQAPAAPVYAPVSASAAVERAGDVNHPPSPSDHEIAPAGYSPPPAPRRPEGERPLASPAVRRRAEDLGVRLSQVAGGGPGGRIRHEDLDAFLSGRANPREPVAAAPAKDQRRTAVDEIKVIGLRRKIAEKMQEAKRRIPHFAYVEEIDMSELEGLRAHLNARHPDRGKLTVLPFFMRALVRILPAFPQINARYDDDAGVVRRYSAVHIGIATQTPNGLIVPVVRHAEALDLWQAAAEVSRLAAATRAGKAKPEELTGSTITLTSLGPLGGVVTTPVINHPEVAIIGPNKIIDRPVIRDGAVAVRKMMNLSSSFDHRVVDGFDAAEFIQRVKAALEHPATLFID
jgi:2-oxoisovalerate dehydrogenase E2 component (dihydrolipoyl transacylase)